MKNLLINLSITLIVFFVAGEAITRVIFKATPKPPPYDTAEVDKYFGWKPKDNYHYQGKMRDLKGVEYDLNLSTNESGFRFYDQTIVDSLPKIFIVGDSYTQSVEVSDDKIFYALLKDSMPMNLFAFGMAGYGNYQEYLILDKYLEEINPDLVILQVCSNDFIDNHHLMEMESIYQVGLRRPYLGKAGQTEYHIPKPLGSRIAQKSKFLTFLQDRFKILQIKYNKKDKKAEALIAELGLEYENYKQSIDITERVFKLIKDRVGSKADLMVLCTDDFEPQFSQLRSISDQVGLPFLDQPIKKLQEIRYQGNTVNSNDGYHWNERGHQIMATELLKELKNWQANGIKSQK